MAKRGKNREPGTGSVFQRTRDKRWVAQVLLGYDERGRARYKLGVCRSQAAAISKLNEIMARVTTGQSITTDRQTVSTYLSSWLKTKAEAQLAPKTLAYYKLMVERHIIPSLGRTDLTKLSANQVQVFLNEKARPTTYGDRTTIVGPYTVRGIRAVLRAALADAWRLGLVSDNVALKVRTPKIIKSDPVYLDPEQAAQLCKAAQGHAIENLIRLTLGTGLRIGEATGVRWQDVEVESGILRVTVQLQRIAGKLVHKPLKSASSRRVLALVGLALEAIQAEKLRYDRLRSTLGQDGFNPLGLVFLNDEGRPLDGKYVDKHLKKLCANAKIPEISFHKLRHTAATLMVAAGVPLALVKDQLGHSSITLTTGTYAHMVPSAQKQAAETLNGALQSGKRA